MDGKRKKEYFDNMYKCIEEYGYYNTYVGAGDNPAFCYTTGLFKTFNIPEIFISSLPPNLSYEITKGYLKTFEKIESITYNVLIYSITDRFPVVLIPVALDRLNDYVLSSFKFYGKNQFDYCQCVFPDTQGYFPNDNRYRYDQEIMGDFYIK